MLSLLPSSIPLELCRVDCHDDHQARHNQRHGHECDQAHAAPTRWELPTNDPVLAPRRQHNLSNYTSPTPRSSLRGRPPRNLGPH